MLSSLLYQPNIPFVKLGLRQVFFLNIQFYKGLHITTKTSSISCQS